jgi:hypothetical protein
VAESSNHLLFRWLFLLRALGLIYFQHFSRSSFKFAGSPAAHGILAAGPYLQAVAQSPLAAVWYTPTGFSSGNAMLNFLCWAGMIASLLLVLNLWPRAVLAKLAI